MAVRKRARQIAGRARAGAARVVTVIRERARRASASRPVTVIAGRSGSRRRRVAGALARGGGVVALAQAKIVPAALGGYALGKLERYERKLHADQVAGKGSGAHIKDPQTRLIAELAGLALLASRSPGMVRDIAVGAAGMVGGLYEMYTDDTGTNPVDGYRKAVLAGDSGV